MQHKITQLPDLPVIGFEIRTTTQDGRNHREIPAFWDRVIQSGDIERIPGRLRKKTLLGICLDGEKSGAFTYLIAAEARAEGALPKGMVRRTIAASRYAVFTARGPMPESIPQAFQYIFGEWLPDSGYRQADGAVIEWYDERFHKGDEAELDIYLPIVGE